MTLAVWATLALCAAVIALAVIAGQAFSVALELWRPARTMADPADYAASDDSRTLPRPVRSG